MNLWFRLLYLLVVSWFRPRLGYFDESVLRMRVWLSDIDVNIHMNNARYLAVMDLGRFDLFLRTGMGRTFVRRRFFLDCRSTHLPCTNRPPRRCQHR